MAVHPTVRTAVGLTAACLVAAGTLLAAPAAHAATCAAQFAGRGSGTPADPYQVSSRDDLETVTNCLDKSFRQTADIDLLNVIWTPIGPAPLTGSYDGGGHTIARIYLNGDTATNRGLFAEIGDGAVVRDLSIVDSQVFTNTTGYSYGLLAGVAGQATLEGISTAGYVHARSYVGGIVGQAQGTTIRNSSSSANARGSSGGLAIGGLVGYARDATITDCHATGTISTYGSGQLGGLVGQIYAATTGSITRSYATGYVVMLDDTGGGLLGGLVGYARTGGSSTLLTISDSYSTGAVGSQEPASPVTRVSSVGGLIGELNGVVGDLVLERSWSTSNTYGKRYSAEYGGLIGTVYADSGSRVSVSRVSSGGRVTFGDDTLSFGGLVGRLGTGPGGTIRLDDVETSAEVTATSEAGGLVGSTDDEAPGAITVTNAYARGPVSGTSQSGGAFGYTGTGITVTSTYWDTQTSGQATSAAGEGRTSAQMTQQATYSGWAFGTFGDPAAVWGMCPAVNAGYPFLQSLQSSDQCPGRPMPPRSPSVTASGSSGATVSWTAPIADGGSPITTYMVTPSPRGTPCTTPDGGTRSCTVTGLPAGTYSFSVQAVNALGTSDPSPSVSLTVDGAPAVPTAQVAAPAPRLPAKVKRKGRTVLLRGPVTTNAGQTATATVKVKATKKPRKQDRRFYRVRTSTAGVLFVRLTGRVACRVTLTLTAPATSGFTAYRQTTTWKVRRART